MNRSPGLRSESIRRQNLSTVLTSVHREGASSRSDLVKRTGLTRSSMGDLVSELTRLGFVVEAAPPPDGSPGRPSPIVQADASGNVVMGIDLMVDSVGVTADGLGGQRLHSARRYRPRSRVGLDETVAMAVELVDQIRADIDGARVHAIGVAVPGMVRRSDQRMVLAPNLGWPETDLKQLFKSRLDFDGNVLVGNEADLGALAESRRGVAAGLNHVIYLSGEVGIGGGIIADGRLLRGRDGLAGEAGHIPVNLDGRQCRCGAIGCLETEVGEETLLQRAGLSSDGGREAVDELITAARAGDPSVQEALSAHAHWLAVGLATLVNLFDTDAVVLGGLLGDLLPSIASELEPALKQRLLPAQADTPVLAAAFGIDACGVGAAEMAWDSVLDDPLRPDRQR